VYGFGTFKRSGSMSGPAPKPADQRRRRNKPVRGEWQPTPGLGWQAGPIPPPPDGLMPASLVAWDTWMSSWIASHWTPTDLPGLRTLIRLYDQVERGEYVRATELRVGMDTYGITPKGQQDRRWSPPKAEEAPVTGTTAPTDGRYAHLRAV
jgi:hypothetical protein